MTIRIPKNIAQQIRDALAAGDSVYVPGIGTFTRIQYKAYRTIAPKTGRSFRVPSMGRVSFRPDGALKDVVSYPQNG